MAIANAVSTKTTTPPPRKTTPLVKAVNKAWARLQSPALQPARPARAGTRVLARKVQPVHAAQETPVAKPASAAPSAAPQKSAASPLDAFEMLVSQNAEGATEGAAPRPARKRGDRAAITPQRSLRNWFNPTRSANPPPPPDRLPD